MKMSETLKFENFSKGSVKLVQLKWIRYEK